MRKKKQTFNKIIKVIKSCKTPDHLQVAVNMAREYSDRYPDFLSSIVDVVALEDYSINRNIREKLDARFDEVELELKYEKGVYDE